MVSSTASRFFFLMLIWSMTGLSSVQALTVTGLNVFGDSLSDQGNSNGSIYSIPSAISAAYYQGRWSNGPVWIEYVNNALGLAPLTRNDGGSFTGSNYAYGGSTSGEQTDIYGAPLPHLQTQVGRYTTSASAATDLFVVWSGGNDVINKVQGSTTGDPLTGPGNIALAIDTLYSKGARQFLIPNLPALGFKPSFQGTANEEIANDLVEEFNSLLTFQLNQVQTDHPDVVILRLDVYGLVNSILLDPSAYGFTNVTQGALNVSAVDPENYLFWDDTHPTTAGHQLIAEEALAIIPEPGTNMAIMGVFLVALAAMRKKARIAG